MCPATEKVRWKTPAFYTLTASLPVQWESKSNGNSSMGIKEGEPGILPVVNKSQGKVRRQVKRRGMSSICCQDLAEVDQIFNFSHWL